MLCLAELRLERKRASASLSIQGHEGSDDGVHLFLPHLVHYIDSKLVSTNKNNSHKSHVG